MSEQPKLSVLQLFLAMVAKYMPLDRAVLATLGGRGMEAQLWTEKGVNPDNAWLIERNRSLSHELIRSLPYRYCGNLSAFPRVFRGVNGVSAGIDGFHLDLCGTIEPKSSELGKILPLIKKSKARCLAITVADGRRNLTLELFEKTAAGLNDVLGQELRDGFLDHLLREQQALAKWPDSYFNPEKGVKRESGVFLNIALLLLKLRGSKVVIPDAIERYIYVSNYGRSSFRMRTYFLHFGKKFLRRRELGRCLAKVWQQSKLMMFYDGSFNQLVLPEKEEVLMPTAQATAYSRLEALAQAADGEALEQFNALKAAAEKASDVADKLCRIKELISEIPAVTQLEDVQIARLRRKLAPATATGNGVTVEKDNVDVELDLMRAAVHGKNALKKAYEQASHDLGLNGRRYANSRNRKIGAMFARTQGRFRPSFAKACAEKFGQSILTELAQIYGALGQQVTSAELLVEISAN